MIIYLLAFALSAGCFAAAGSGRIQYRLVRWGFWALGLLFPAVLAGLRASCIGTDVEIYGITPYEWATWGFSTLGEYLAVCRIQYGDSLLYDQLFWILLWLCGQICPDYHFGLFAYNLVFLIFLFLGVKRCCRLRMGCAGGPCCGQSVSAGKERPSRGESADWLPGAALCMLICYLLMYNRSLNLMRLFIAIAMVFYGATFLPERKIVRALAVWVVAVLFHSSALLGAAVALLYVLSITGRGKRLSRNLGKAAFLALVLFLLLMFYGPIIRMLVNSGLLRDNYLIYIPESTGGYQSPIRQAFSVASQMAHVLLKADGLLAAALALFSVGTYIWEEAGQRKMPPKAEEETAPAKGCDGGYATAAAGEGRLFHVMCAIVYLMFVLSSGISSDWIRVSFYFLPFIAADHGLVLRRIASDYGRKAGALSVMGYLVFQLVFWYQLYVVDGAGATVPYLFLWQS